MEFFRPEYWSGKLFPSPGDLPNPGIEARPPALQADSLPAEPPRKPLSPWAVGFQHGNLGGGRHKHLEHSTRRHRDITFPTKVHLVKAMVFPVVMYGLDWRRQWHPTPYSCLENPMDGGAWWAAVHGVARSRTRLSDFTFTFHFHALEKEMATHSSVLA